MKHFITFLIIFFFFLTLFSQTTWTVKQDGTGNFSSIQQAINTSVSGDTIVVHNGRYYENIIYNGKNIYLTSLFKYTNNREDIYNTIIDANHQSSGIQIRNGETDAVINGFTITNGIGSTVPPSIERGGGGIHIRDAKATILNNIIKNNNATSSGGGIFIVSNQKFYLSGNIIKDNTVSSSSYLNDGGGIWIHPYAEVEFDPINKNSVFNNRALRGQDISYFNNLKYFYAVFDTFTVASNDDFFIDTTGDFFFQTDNYVFEPINHDLYVCPLNGDDLNNDGLSWSSPFKTIKHAMYNIASDPIHPKTIYLAPGIYSRSNGQEFHFIMKSNVNLQGAGRDITIFDGEQGKGFIVTSPKTKNNSISDISFKNTKILRDKLEPIPIMLMGLDNLEIIRCSFEDGYAGVSSIGLEGYPDSLNAESNVFFSNLTFSNNTWGQLVIRAGFSVFENIIISNLRKEIAPVGPGHF